MPADIEGKIFKKYKKNTTLFIETGTYIGDGIKSAINAGFENIISIEISKFQYDYCEKMFKDNKNVSLFLGDSREVLHNILSNDIIKNQGIFFWLDAHFSGGVTGGEGIRETLYKELEIILEYTKENKVNAVIAIDDMDTVLYSEVEEIMNKYNAVFLGKEVTFIYLLFYEVN
jgi:hypothetical protein